MSNKKKKRTQIALGVMALIGFGVWVTKSGVSMPNMPSFDMPSWVYYVVGAVLIAAIAIYVKKRRRHGSQSVDVPITQPEKRTPMMYLDDVGHDEKDRWADGNGPQDWLCALGLGDEIYGNLVSMGSTHTHGHHDTGVNFAREINKAVGKSHIPVYRGAPKFGMNQGSSELAREIIKQAHKHGKLIVAVGGPITDVALAVKKDPSIAKKLRLSVLAGWNWDQDKVSAAYVNEHVRGINRFDHDEWKTVMNQIFNDKKYGGNKKERGDNFASKYFGFNDKLKKLVMNSHWTNMNRGMNAEQIKVGSALRIADLLAIFMAYEGKQLGLTGSHILPILEKALDKLKAQAPR